MSYGALVLNATMTVTPASAAAVTIVGETDGHTTTSSTNIALPAGCAAGDLAVISVSRASTCTITPPSGSADLLADYAFYTTALAHVYGYTLTATDISNGYVSFSASSTANYYNMLVLHSSSVTPSVDVTGTAATASPNNTHPINIPANSITTLTANDLVLAFGFVYLASSTSTTFTTPSGWTAASVPTPTYSYRAPIYSLAMPTAGATGDASITATASANTRGGGIQIAFQP